MPAILYKDKKMTLRLGFVLFVFMLASCGKPFVKKAPPGKYYLYKNNIEVKGGNFRKPEKEAILQRLKGQLDDSAKVKIKSHLFIINILKKPFVYDSSLSGK